MTKYYRKLKYLMAEECISHGDICCLLGRSWAYVNNRMNGNAEWTMSDVYKICDVLHIPYTDIPVFFPKGGISVTKNAEAASCWN